MQNSKILHQSPKNLKNLTKNVKIQHFPAIFDIETQPSFWLLKTACAQCSCGFARKRGARKLGLFEKIPIINAHGRSLNRRLSDLNKILNPKD
jgi:hypothetical protein